MQELQLMNYVLQRVSKKPQNQNRIEQSNPHKFLDHHQQIRNPGEKKTENVFKPLLLGG